MNSINSMDRYDRQNRTYGEDATKKLTTSVAVIIGLSGGLATETCKNLILSGFSNLILIDDGLVESSDLNTGFYYNENDIEAPRCKVLQKRLLELNPNTNISHKTLDQINFALLDALVILHNSPLQTALDLNKVCRESSNKFIWVKSKGVSGTIFVDALKNHKISDMTGEVIDPVQLASIDNEGLVTCAQHNSHDFQDNDIIKFTNLAGDNLEFLSEKHWQIKTINRFCFKIVEFPSQEFDFINGTAIVQKQVNTISHNSLDEEIKNNSIVGFNQDFDKEIIKFYTSIDDVKFKDCWGDEMNQFLVGYEDDNVKKIIRSSVLELMPVVSVVASLASMEAIKLITGKFLPITQWMVYSDSSLVPDTKPDDVDEFGIGNLLGSEVKYKIEGSNFFLVGCGAIGCEMLKNLAKLNFATNGGMIHVTDPDHIEHSNLSRQFLFRNEHIKNSKSKIACQMIRKMNPKINIEAMLNKVCPENQELFDNMAPRLFAVINALDNIEARRYVDEQCFRYGKALFESGTQGMKGNTQPVIPFVTETYSNSSDPPQEKSFPVCTIKNFPNQPEHTVHWAMDYFELFRRGPQNVENYQKDPKNFLNNLSDYDKNLAKEDIYKYRVKYDPKTWKDCVRWATDMFLELYRDQILQLLHSFPKDSLTSDGELFWSKGKRCPSPVDFDIQNDLVIDFIEACTHLLAKTRLIDVEFTREELKAELVDFVPYQFVIDEKKTIAKDDSELDKEKSNNKEIELPDFENVMWLSPEIFEKDDDSNWHVAFIAATANLRCSNYGIPTSTFDETKGIAGKIVPAVATTTSIVAGLITMEILKYCLFNTEKYVGNEKIIEKYRSCFVSLANNILVPSEPMPAPMREFGDVMINSWTKFELTEDMTLGKFILIFGAKFDTEISMVLFGSSIIYFDTGSKSDSEGKLLSQIFKEKYDFDLFSKNAEIVIASEGDVELPTIEVKLSRKLDLSV